jgi:hypothetical protein
MQLTISALVSSTWSYVSGSTLTLRPTLSALLQVSYWFSDASNIAVWEVSYAVIPCSFGVM